MAKSLEVVSITVSTRFQGNGRPRSGWAKFSDGKEYEFHEWEEAPGYWDAHVKFYVHYVRFPDAPPGCRGGQTVSFQSPKRAEALKKFIENA